MKKEIPISIKVFAIGTAILSIIIFLISFYEYYTVSIQKDIEFYAFGTEGPVAEIKYYENANNYSIAMLESCLICILSIASITIGLKRNKFWLLIFGAIMLLTAILAPYFDMYIL